MRSIIITLMFLISIPALFFYGFYLTLDFYSFFAKKALFFRAFNEPFMLIIRGFMNLSGIFAWIGLAVMACSWYQYKKLSSHWPFVSTILAILGIFGCFFSQFSHFAFSPLSPLILLSVPSMLWALYLCKWHLSQCELSKAES